MARPSANAANAIPSVFERLEARQLLSVAIVDGRQLETLDRGLIAMPKSGGQVYVGWRMLATDPDDITFNLYRSTAGGAAVKVNSSPIAQTTDFVNTGVDTTRSHAYFVRPVVDGVEQASSGAFTVPANPTLKQYLSVPLQPPAPVTTADGVVHTYHANDTSVGDLDGDGSYEFIVKWEAVESAASGYNAGTYLDAISMDGTRLWRAYSGPNIKTGAQFFQFIVYDFDGDGKAEVVFNSADGAVSGTGQIIGDPTKDWRTSYDGYVVTGPEYLTLLNGQTGEILSNTSLQPARGLVTDWGDNYGHRSNTFNATVAYLDGERPSLVFGRGIYHGRDGNPAKTQIVAYDWRGGVLSTRWTFTAASNGANPTYVGQGNHQSTVGDVDGDGRDEIIWGAMTVDDNGAPLYSTRLGHGDALHMSDMDPSRPGLEVFGAHESPSEYTRDVNGDGIADDNGGSFRDARTGQVLVGIPGNGGDVGRGIAMDIDPRPGFEMWTSANPNIYNVDGTVVAAKPSNMFINSGVWWDGDLYRELLDRTTISKWNPGIGRSNFDLDPAISGIQGWAPGAATNNSTKENANLSGDILGDWREEIVFRSADSSELRIFTTTIPAQQRLDTLMHDPMYRQAIAWQNVYYNQPPHTSFYLGQGMVLPAAAPTNLSASASALNRVNLAWTGSAGATSYSVKRATSPQGPFTVIASSVTGTSFVDATVNSSQAYYYFVTAVNAAGGSLNSNPASATTPAATNAAPTIAAAAKATPAPVSGTTTSLSVLGADDGGEAALRYTWNVSGPGAVVYTGNGTNTAKTVTATFSRAGTYSFTCTVVDAGGLTAQSAVNVLVSQALSQIDVTPATTTLSYKATQQFLVNGYDQFGQVLTTRPAAAWSISGGIGSINSTGLYTAPAAAGTATVKATVGNRTDTATLTILGTPAAPSNLAASQITYRKAKLTWLDNATNEKGFRIWSSRDGTTWAQIGSSGRGAHAGTTRIWTSNRLATGTWFFRIAAYNDVGNSPSTPAVKLVIT